ncbi:uncharacterized protein VICG_00695 [Vittaforma corneae ATCC 50505]|uniref:Secreted protein n=1 Tax=Vittaforma corneae (strain ATCC 50505) TaxID=993615 RepID=L2GP53_VITCO|nr:uncharacterized protein VICG_00695 [Vittaforma corneae ATCC 50505]ELA42295.1 hypothetical protein VICG_00695 [Vittaforma corneae ATCC 50505]
MQAKFEMKLILLMILNVFTAKLEEESITPHEDSKCEFHTASLKFSSISNKSSVQSGSTIPWVSKHEAYFFTASSPDKDNHELRVCKNCYSQFELFQSVLDCVKNGKV